MAEAIIVNIAVKIIEDLAPRALANVGKLWGVKHELEKLKNTVSTVQDILKDAKGQHYQNHLIQGLLDRLKDASYDAQDLFEEFNIEAMRRQLRGHNEMIKEVRTFFSKSNQVAFKLKMSYKVRAVREKIEAIKADNDLNLLVCSQNLQVEREQREREETHSFRPEGVIIGRDDGKKRVKKFLLDTNVQEDVSILPIVGIGGLGKTALAQFVYNDEMVSKQFHLKIWVCVSDNFDMKKIVTNIIACVKDNAPRDVAMEQLQSELRGKLDGKRYLLVLDDLWNEEEDKWLSLKYLLVGGARGSKILITTRSRKVAEITHTTEPYYLEGLSNSASFDLLMQIARKKVEDIQDLEMLSIIKEIAKKCYGVPLVVRTVGRLLSFKKNKNELLHFKDDELPNVSQGDDHINSIFRLSYDHLPSHLKQCFVFCSLFPKDYEIEKQTLVDLWIAEGFIQPSYRSQHLEDIAHGYFMDLLWSNFFQDFKKDPYTNRETCKMHDLIHDLACSVAGTEYSVASYDFKSIHEKTRHISHGLTSYEMGKFPISCLKASALRTFLSTTHPWEWVKPLSEANLCQLIRHFKKLRILDWHSESVQKVPRSICKLKHLTYLNLSSNNALKRLPNSITRLQNLQTLNLSMCENLEELPRGIRDLVNLRNLDIDGCRSLSYMPRGLGQLSSLHRLKRFILPKHKAHAKNYCGLGELKGLNDIRGSLHIENLGSVTDAVAESKAANLIRKHYLESLTLEWGSFNTNDAIIGDRDEALLNGLRPHSSLQKLTIKEYKGEIFPRWMMDSLGSALPNLVEVRFSNCKRCKHLPPLGQLLHLKTLEIKELTESEYIKPDHLSTSTLSFPNLLTLRIINSKKLKAMPRAPHLEDLSLIGVDSTLINHMLGLNKLKRLLMTSMEFLECLPEEFLRSLTSLVSLNISFCPRLTSLALGLRHLSKLVNLHIVGCRELDLSKDVNGNIISDLHGGLQNLRSLEFGGLRKLESLPQWLLQARNLKHLEIWDCNNLRALPERIEALQSLQQLEIRDCKELVLSKDERGNIILDFHGGLQSLRSVYFSGIPKLESLPQWLLQARNLKHLEIRICNDLKALPEQIEALQSLQQLKIECCGSLTSLPERIEALQSLQSLDIRFCDSLTSLPEGMRGLASLMHLSISNCKELDLSKDERGNILDFHGGLQSLRSVEIHYLPKVESLPPWLLQLSNLKHLQISNCSNLKALPEQIEALQSLQKLQISHCPSLTSLPEGMRRLTSLTELIIIKCPELKERCKRDAGEDWCKIAKFPF